MSHPIPPFRVRLEQALADDSLAQGLTRTLAAFKSRRDAAMAEVDFEALRDDLRARKTAAMADLPELIERFRIEAEKVGSKVYLAHDAAEANRIIVEIAQSRNARLVVKSKSMATEEIGLNAHLEAAGIQVVETDLGEWIVQLADDRPSHLIAPALHKSKEQVAELFSKRIGQPLPPDPAQLVKVARRELRRMFVEADLGISGANFAIAETGTIGIVTNEGNAELVTTLPPVHIALLGVEKIVPTIDDATAVLKLLSKSGTGQKFTSYVTWLTGPSRTADIELQLQLGAHGPEERHIVLIDNGRMAMREDPTMREALHCIRCGACANVCPAYQVVGGHVFGHIYTGPIGLMLTAAHHGIEAAGGPQSLCMSCNACEQICPAGIPLPRQILEVRRQYVEQKGLPAPKRAALQLLASRSTADLLSGLARLGQLPLIRKTVQGSFLKLPLAGKLTKWRSLPALAGKPLHSSFNELMQNGHDAPRTVILGSKATGVRVGYFAGCLTDRLYPEMGRAIVDVLQASGANVAFPELQNCCGLAANNAGDRNLAKSMAKQTIEMLEGLDVDYVLSGSTSCVAAIAQDYFFMFQDEPEWQERAAKIGHKMIDFTRFISDVAQIPVDALRCQGDLPLVTLHDSCQSFNALGLYDEPRRIVEEVMGLPIAEMAESSVCCGFGGSFSFDHPEVSRAVLSRKLENASATQARIIVTDNPGCIMHMRGGIDASGRSIEVLHLAELMARQLERKCGDNTATTTGE